MAYFAVLWKARTIERYRRNYESEKIKSIMMSKTEIPKQSLSQRWRHYRYDTQKRISRTFRKWYPEGSAISNFFLYLKTDQTFPNFVMKSVLGFVGGIILTYLCFMFFIFQLSISLIHATIMSSIIGVLLTLGLAFSYRIRCLVFLLIPQFFSRVGRYTLTCYALVLILTGPATNTLKNSEVLSESLACGQEQIKTSVNHINTLMTKPLNGMKESIELMVDKLRDIAVKMKGVLVKTNRLVLSVGQVIQSGYLWLNSLSEICNQKLGTSYQRCRAFVNEGIRNCKTTLASNGSTHCGNRRSSKETCSKLKNNVVSIFVNHVNGNIVPIIKKRLKNFTERIRHMFYMQVHVHHSYSFSSNSTRTASQVAAGIVTEIRKRADPLLTWLSWSSCGTSVFLLLIIFRAKHYQHMFETRSRFDNRYITKEIRDLDLRRLREGRETILPLNRRERAKYVTTTSFRLVASEKEYVNRSTIFMVITTFKLLIHMVADYSLYWVLMTIRYHGRFQSPTLPGEPPASFHVSGSGPTADLVKAMMEALGILLEPPVSSPVSCLPNPYQPDFKRYTQIGVLIFLLWFFAVFEPYGLRLRHVVMGHYQPDRAKVRAAWLYDHILRTRGGFMKCARRKLHRTFKYKSEESFTFRRWLNSIVPFSWLRTFLGISPDEPKCLLCGTIYYKYKPNTELIRCKSSNCPGIYCSSCFTDIGELCTICLYPKDYGDLSDISLEKGSSDDSDNEDEGHPTKRNYPSEICEGDIDGTSKDSFVDRAMRKYKKGMFSKNSRQSEDTIPLITRKCQSQPKYECIKCDPNKPSMKRAMVIRHLKHCDNRDNTRYNNGVNISCMYCNNNHCIKSTNDRITGKQKNINVEEELHDVKVADKLSVINRNITRLPLNSKRKLFMWNVHNKTKKTKPTKEYGGLQKGTSFINASLTTDSVKKKLKGFVDSKLNYSIKNKHWANLFYKCRKKKKKKMLVEHKQVYYSEAKNKSGGKRKRSKNLMYCSTPCYCNHQNDKSEIEEEKKNKKKDKKKKKVNKSSSMPENNSVKPIPKVHSPFFRSWNIFKTKTRTQNKENEHEKSNKQPPSSKKKNHKRRKKKNKKTQSEKNEKISERLESDEGREYRISAYLADQDWIKRRSKNNIHTKVKTELGEANVEISEALAEINSSSVLTKIIRRKVHNLSPMNKKAEEILKVAVETPKEEDKKNQNSGHSEKSRHKRITFSEICRRFGVDLMTASSSKSYVKNFLKSTHHLLTSKKKSSNSPISEVILKLYSSIESGALRQLIFTEDRNLPTDNSEVEICVNDYHFEEKKIESDDPIIGLVASECSVNDAEKLLMLMNKKSLKQKICRLTSDIPNRLSTGFRGSVSLFRNMCYRPSSNSTNKSPYGKAMENETPIVTRPEQPCACKGALKIMRRIDGCMQSNKPGVEAIDCDKSLLGIIEIDNGEVRCKPKKTSADKIIQFKQEIDNVEGSCKPKKTSADKIIKLKQAHKNDEKCRDSRFDKNLQTISTKPPDRSANTSCTDIDPGVMVLKDSRKCSCPGEVLEMLDRCLQTAIPRGVKNLQIRPDSVHREVFVRPCDKPHCESAIIPLDNQYERRLINISVDTTKGTQVFPKGTLGVTKGIQILVDNTSKETQALPTKSQQKIQVPDEGIIRVASKSLQKTDITTKGTQVNAPKSKQHRTDRGEQLIENESLQETSVQSSKTTQVYARKTLPRSTIKERIVTQTDNTKPRLSQRRNAVIDITSLKPSERLVSDVSTQKHLSHLDRRRGTMDVTRHKSETELQPINVPDKNKKSELTGLKLKVLKPMKPLKHKKTQDEIDLTCSICSDINECEEKFCPRGTQYEPFGINERGQRDDSDKSNRPEITELKVIKPVKQKKKPTHKMDGDTCSICSEPDLCIANVCTSGTQYESESSNSTTFLNQFIEGDNVHSVVYEYSSSTDLSSDTFLSSFKSSTNTRSDNVYNMAVLENTPTKKHRSRRRRLFSKGNQCSRGSKHWLCDAETTTKDWWSPILEKKHKAISFRTKVDHIPPKEYVPEENYQEKLEKKKHKAARKIVSFRSQPQIIPLGRNDILSPSRYLLESQKYYNELFMSGFNTRLYRVSISQRYNDEEKSPSTGIHCIKRNFKTKRLVECYSPRKQLSPRKFEWTRASEDRSQNRMNYYRSTPRSKSSRYSKNPYRPRQSYAKGAPLTKASRRQSDLACTDDMSLVCRCNSTSSF